VHQQTIHPAWNVSYASKPAQAPRRLVILLHGFQQTGSLILNMLEDCFDESCLVISPNGPFPFPYKNANATSYRLAYAWYFFDPKTNVFGVPMDLAVNYLSELVSKLDAAPLPKWVIGYSQGGYLAPFAANALTGVERVLTINARFRSEALKESYPYRCDAVHGVDDAMVDFDRSQRCHAEILATGNRGRFHAIAGAGHRITRELRDGVREILCETD